MIWGRLSNPIFSHKYENRRLGYLQYFSRLCLQQRSIFFNSVFEILLFFTFHVCSWDLIKTIEITQKIIWNSTMFRKLIKTYIKVKITKMQLPSFIIIGEDRFWIFSSKLSGKLFKGKKKPPILCSLHRFRRQREDVHFTLRLCDLNIVFECLAELDPISPFKQSLFLSNAGNRLCELFLPNSIMF